MRIVIRSTDRPIHGYLAVPQAEVSGPGPWPGVVVVPDVLGLSDDIRTIADRFATAGYLAVVPDLYSRGGLFRCVRSVMRQLMDGRGQAFDDIEAARKLLLDRTDCTGATGVAGFCLGGGFALLAAAKGFDASAPYYGSLPRDESALDGACPIVASYGAKDGRLKGAADELEKLLADREIPADVKEYPRAGHSFANRMPVGPFGPLLRVAGVGYHHDSSEDAWRRVMTFFRRHLGEAGRG